MNKEKLLIISLVILSVALVGGGLFYTQKHRNTKPVVAGGPTPVQQKQASDVETSRKKESIEGSSKNDQPTNTIPSTPSQPSAGVISLSAKQETNGSVTVFTKVTGIGNGTCKLTVTNSSKSATQSADLIYQPEYSSCAGFSVPVGGLGAGTWNITLDVTSSGSTITKSITQVVN